jgi:ferredoxin-NADP reductase
MVSLHRSIVQRALHRTTRATIELHDSHCTNDEHSYNHNINHRTAQQPLRHENHCTAERLLHHTTARTTTALLHHRSARRPLHYYTATPPFCSDHYYFCYTAKRFLNH